MGKGLWLYTQSHLLRVFVQWEVILNICGRARTFLQFRSLLSVFTEIILILIPGNKSDLAESERVVTIEEGKLLARRYGAAFFETSAKCRFNVEDAFFELVRYFYQKKHLKTHLLNSKIRNDRPKRWQDIVTCKHVKNTLKAAF